MLHHIMWFNISVLLSGDFGLAKTLKADDLASSVTFFSYFFNWYTKYCLHLLFVSVLRSLMNNGTTYLILVCSIFIVLVVLSVIRILCSRMMLLRLWEHQITCARSCLQTFLMASSQTYGLLVMFSYLYRDV